MAATLTYTQAGGNATITGRSSTGYELVVIPATTFPIDGTNYPIVALAGSLFSGSPEIVGLDMSGATNLKIIGGGAFGGCTGLFGSLIIPNSVTDIGNGAFGTCSNLNTNLTIGSSVTSIGDNAFENCSFTGSLIFNSGTAPTIGSNVFGQVSFSNLTVGASATSIVEGWYSNFYSFVGTLTIGSLVQTIGTKAFSFAQGGCSFTGELNIPDSVITIGDYAFSNNSGFTYLRLGNSVANLGYDSFYGCSSFTGISLPQSLTTIDSAAFNNCTLASIEVRPNITTPPASNVKSGVVYGTNNTLLGTLGGGVNGSGILGMI